MVVGTNATIECWNTPHHIKVLPKEWKNAFVTSKQTSAGVIKLTNAFNITVQPRETLSPSGFVRKNRQVEAFITEQTEWASTKIGVCHWIVSLQKIEYLCDYTICLQRYCTSSQIKTFVNYMMLWSSGRLVQSVQIIIRLNIISKEHV